MRFTLARLARVSGWAQDPHLAGQRLLQQPQRPGGRSESYANLHDQLMSWEECQPLAARFCEQAGIPSEPSALTAFYRRKLAGSAAGELAPATRRTRLDLEPRVPFAAAPA
jgi:hypothetical protein